MSAAAKRLAPHLSDLRKQDAKTDRAIGSLLFQISHGEDVVDELEVLNALQPHHRQRLLRWTMQSYLDQPLSDYLLPWLNALLVAVPVPTNLMPMLDLISLRLSSTAATGSALRQLEGKLAFVLNQPAATIPLHSLAESLGFDAPPSTIDASHSLAHDVLDALQQKGLCGNADATDPFTACILMDSDAD